MNDWHEPMRIWLDGYERTTLICALLRYGMEVAHPEDCVTLLNRIHPTPDRPWEELLDEARTARRALDIEATRGELDAQKVAAQRDG